MKRIISLILALAICFYSCVWACPDPAIASPDQPGDGAVVSTDKEDAIILTVIIITLTAVGAAASIMAWLGAGEEPNAETYAWAYAGDWGCGQTGSESDEAYGSDISAESNAGEFTCEHGAKARAYTKAFWEQIDRETAKGKMIKEPIYGWAPSSCYGQAKATAKLKGTSAWEKKVGFRNESDTLHMQLSMNFEEFLIRALDDSVTNRDERGTITILIQAAFGSETWTVFDGQLINTGTELEATGSFEGLDLVRTDDGTVTFGDWPDSISVYFYVPDSSEITVSALVTSDVSSHVVSQIPTLSQFGLLILVLAIAGFSVYMIMRRKRANAI